MSHSFTKSNAKREHFSPIHLCVQTLLHRSRQKQPRDRTGQFPETPKIVQTTKSIPSQRHGRKGRRISNPVKPCGGKSVHSCTKAIPPPHVFGRLNASITSTFHRRIRSIHLGEGARNFIRVKGHPYQMVTKTVVYPVTLWLRLGVAEFEANIPLAF